MNDVLGWIQLLYKRHTAEHALHTVLLLEHMNEFIAGEADAQPDGREQLRRVALIELESHDPQLVAFSLVCLGVVGRPHDLPAAKRFVTHPSDLMQRAARECIFRLQKQNISED